LRTRISPAIAGLAISNTLSLAQYLNTLLERAADAETTAVHVERCIEFAEDIPGEDFASSQDQDNQWPQSGAIRFINASARYRPELPLTLSDITLDIQPGSKVAIVGRTGSGKSSLTLTLFRLLELESGRIEIDGTNIRTIALERLRQSISIIPQENQALSGTIRSNLSPFGGHTDDELWGSLEGAGLKATITSLEGKLDAEVAIGGSNFSAGQLQQLGLARALLSQNRIVVLDEATSSLDLETDTVIQRTIRNNFAHATVITIAHRLRTIMDCELVVVMRDGKVAETGPPGELLSKHDSMFFALAREAGEVG
jgi:ATP-binding cassette, subfamily C (CFTR/MRP), member 1